MKTIHEEKCPNGVFDHFVNDGRALLELSREERLKIVEKTIQGRPDKTDWYVIEVGVRHQGGKISTFVQTSKATLEKVILEVGESAEKDFQGVLLGAVMALIENAVQMVHQDPAFVAQILQATIQKTHSELEQRKQQNVQAQKAN